MLDFVSRRVVRNSVGKPKTQGRTRCRVAGHIDKTVTEQRLEGAVGLLLHGVGKTDQRHLNFGKRSQ
ncbi:hypothetical protein GCM10009641_86660 [Mycobacterium cookii]